MALLADGAESTDHMMGGHPAEVNFLNDDSAALQEKLQLLEAELEKAGHADLQGIAVSLFLAGVTFQPNVFKTSTDLKIRPITLLLN